MCLRGYLAVSLTMRGTEMSKYRRFKLKVLSIFTLLVALCGVYLVLTRQAELDSYLRVFNLFGTFIHEGIGHAFVTILTGGRVAEIVVNPDGSGHAMIVGGWLFLSLPAGYMSTTLFMALMFWVNNRTRFGEVIPFIMGILFILMTVLLANKVTDGITTGMVGIVCGILLIYMGYHPNHKIPFTNLRFELPDWMWMSVVNLIAMYYALGGIFSLQYIANHSVSGNSDDITRFADLYLPFMNPAHVAWGFWGLSVLVWVIVLADVIRSYFQNEEEV